MFLLSGQIFFGMIVGALAKLMISGRGTGGVIVTPLVGLAGSVVGTLIGYLIFGAHRAAGLPGWTLSIAGSIVGLGIYRFAIRNRHNPEQGLSIQR